MSDVIVKRFAYYSEIIVIRLNNVMIRIYLSGTYLVLFVCMRVLVTAQGSWLLLYEALWYRLRPLALEEGGGMEEKI